MPRTRNRPEAENADATAQTLSQALKARRGRARAATPPPPRYAPPRRRRARRIWRYAMRTTRRLVALGVLGGAVAAVWYLGVQPLTDRDDAAPAKRTAAASAQAPTSLGKRLASLAGAGGGMTPGLATPTSIPGFSRLHVSVVDASGTKNAGLEARRYLHQLGMHPVPLNTTHIRLKKSVLLYKPGWQTRGLAFARLLGLHAQARRTLPGVPARQPLVLVIGSRGL